MMKDKQEEHKGVNPVAAGTAGAVIGAGLAVAATAAFKNEKTRDKMKEVFDNVKDRAMDKMSHMNMPVEADKAKREMKKVSKTVKGKTKSAVRAAAV